MYDLVIIGGGPAGAAAAVYASRKRLKTAMVVHEWGGQSNVSADVQNWLGTVSISGADLAKALKNHVEAYKSDVLEIHESTRATEVKKDGDTFLITLDNGQLLKTRAVFVATGSTRRKLQAPGADTFENRGLTYCASCDGPMFTDMDVAVIGGGNAGFETAAQLLAYAKSVTLLHHRDEFKADPVTVEKVLSNPKMHAIRNASTTAVIGEKFVSGLRYKDTETGEEKEIAVNGIFVEIGLIPSTDLVKGTVELNEIGQIKVDPRTNMTNVPGIWAAGDCTSNLYHQNNIAAGDAVRALEDIYLHLHTK